MTKTKQIRQGDVLVTKVDAAPPDAIPRAPESGLAILARGEATGHHHAVSSAEAAILAKGAERYLRPLKRTTLRHQEHGPIQIARGAYDVTIQVEYDPTAIARTVVD